MPTSIELLSKIKIIIICTLIFSSTVALLCTASLFWIDNKIELLKGPRTLNQNQQQILLTYFNNNDKSKLKLSSINSDQETFEFAKQIGEIFIQSGWEVNNQINHIQPVGGQYANLTIESPINLLASARVIQNAFMSINIPTSIEQNNSRSEYIEIIVGLKGIN